MLDGVPFIKNPYDEILYTKNSYDLDDERVNLQLLKLAIATRDFIKENNLNKEIIQSASSNAIKSVKFSEILSYPKSMTKTKSKSFQNLKNILDNTYLIHTSTNPSKFGETEKYLPSIYVPNLEIADFNQEPLVGAGFEVNSELPGMEQYEDYIVTWYYDANNNIQEILLCEETAMNTRNPIFIVTNAEERMLERKAEIKKTSNDINGTNSNICKTRTEFHTNEFQINHHYEWVGKSEFCIVAANIDENGIVHNVLRNDNGVYSTWKCIAKVSRSNIGKLQSRWEQFVSNDVTPFDKNYTFWNTFERDWFSSEKFLGDGKANGKNVYLSGNRKYSGDWYAFDPYEVKNNPLDYNTIYGSWAKWYENTKGKLRFWRVEI